MCIKMLKLLLHWFLFIFFFIDLLKYRDGECLRMHSCERIKQIIPVLAFPPVHSRISTPGASPFPTYIRISVEIRLWLNVVVGISD